jgi:hypothetical protein
METGYELIASALSDGCIKSPKFESIYCSLDRSPLIHYVKPVSTGIFSDKYNTNTLTKIKYSLSEIFVYYEGEIDDLGGRKFYGNKFNIFGKVITDSPLNVIKELKIYCKGRLQVLVLCSNTSSSVTLSPGELVEFTLDLDELGVSEEQTIELYCRRNPFINKFAPIKSNRFYIDNKKSKPRRLKIERKPNAIIKIKGQQAIRHSENSILNHEAGVDKSTYNPSVISRYKAKQERHIIVRKKTDPEYDKAEKYLIKYIKNCQLIVPELKSAEILRKIIPDNIKVTTDKRVRLIGILKKAEVKISSKGRPVNTPERNEKINALKKFPVNLLEILIKNRY